MKKIFLYLIVVLLATTGCTKKQKYAIPLPGALNISEEDVNVSASVNGASLSSISISPTNTTIALDTFTNFTATAIYTDGTERDITESVTWSSSDTSIASVSGAKKGRFRGDTAGTSTVTATLGSFSGSTNLTVSTPTNLSISISPTGGSSNVVHTGTSTQYEAIITFNDSNGNTITQNVSDQVVWTGSGSVSVNESGGVSGSSTGNGSVSVALPNANNGSSNLISGSSGTIQVSNGTLVRIEITGNLNPALGIKSQLVATGVYSDGRTENLTSLATWTVSDSNVATANAEGTKGLLQGGQVGTAQVSVAYAGVTTSSNINITPATVVSISISPSTGSLAKGTSSQFTATATYSDGTTSNVTSQIAWSSSDSNVAGVETGANGGKVSANTEGSATITASLNGVTSNIVNVSITAATLQSIAITPNLNSSIAKGLTQQFTATGTYSDGTTQNLTGSVAWASSDSNVISVNNSSAKGNVTATGVGSASLTATINGVTGTKNVDVSSATLVSIAVSPVNLSLAKGLTQQMVAIGTYTDNSTQTLTSSVLWSTSNGSLVSVSNASGSKGLATAEGVGSSSISATLGAVSGSVNFNRTAASIVSISITSANTSIAKGLTEQFTAIATYTDGTQANVTSSVSWSSSNTSAVSINNEVGPNKGLASAIGVGSANITATINGVTGTKSFTASPAALTSIAITSTNASRANGLTEQFTATGTYTDGTTQNITSDVTWIADSNSDGVDDSAIIEISNQTSPNTKGLATAKAVGTATISAVKDGKTSTVTYTVTSAVLQSVAISPLNGSTQTGATVNFTATGTYTDGTTQDVTANTTWKADSDNDGVDDNLVAAISNVDGSKGVLTGVAVGNVTITGTINGYSASTTINVSQGSSATVAVGDKSLTVPNGINQGSAPTGDFTGIVYSGGTNAAGSISIIPDYGQTNSGTLGSTIIGLILNDSPDVVSNISQVSNSEVPISGGSSTIYDLTVTTTSSITPTELSNHIISEAGTNIQNGIVSSLPASQGTETTSNEFRVIVQVTYTSNGSEVIGVGVSTSAEYPNNEALISSFLNGTNIAPAGTQYASKTDTFTGTADPKVDFLWVVDNSGSMSGEQASVQNAATTFFNKLSNKHLDFRLGVITTGSDGGSSECNTNLSKHTGKKAWVLWGPNGVNEDNSWVTSADGISAFTSRINVGTSGCGTETASFFAKYGLENGTITPRNDAKLIVVIVSDEGDHYQCFTGGSKKSYIDAEGNQCSGGTPLISSDGSNYFKTNGHKVYSIIGLNSSTGLPGTCQGTGDNAASYSNNNFNNYYKLAQTTGGSSASICTDDFNPIMDSITTNAAASSSAYTLTRSPVSSSIVVKVNGVEVTKDSTNGWQYNASSNSILFSGTAWPASGANIQVTYNYDTSLAAASSDDSFLLAYLAKRGSSTYALLIGAIMVSVAGLFLRRKFIN